MSPDNRVNMTLTTNINVMIMIMISGAWVCFVKGKQGSRTSLPNECPESVAVTRKQVNSPEVGKKKSILKKSDGLHKEETEKLISDHVGGTGKPFLEVPIGSVTTSHGKSNKDDSLLAPMMTPVTGSALVGSGILGGIVGCVASLPSSNSNVVARQPLKAIGPKTGTKPHAVPIKFVGIEDNDKTNVWRSFTGGGSVSAAKGAESKLDYSTLNPESRTRISDLDGFLESNLEKHAKDESIVENKAKDMDFNCGTKNEAVSVESDKILDLESCDASVGIGELGDNDTSSSLWKCVNSSCKYNQVALINSLGQLCLCGRKMETVPCNKLVCRSPSRGLQLVSHFNEQNDLKSKEKNVAAIHSDRSPTEETKLLGVEDNTRNDIVKQNSKEAEMS